MDNIYFRAGLFINFTMQLNMNLIDDEIIKLGEEVLSIFEDKHLGYKTIKRNFSKYLPIYSEMFPRYTSTADLRKFSENAELTYVYYNLSNPLQISKDPFIVKFSQDCKRFITIECLESFSPGAGRKLLQEFIEDVKGIPVIARVHLDMYLSEDRENISKIVEVFKSVGFKDVDDKYGNPENEGELIMLHTNSLPHIAYKYVPEKYFDEFMSLLPDTVTDPVEIKNLADMFMKMKGDK